MNFMSLNYIWLIFRTMVLIYQLDKIVVPQQISSLKSTENELYKPIRIKIFLSENIKKELLLYSLMDNLFRNAISKITSLLSVIPITSNLLLKRPNGCKNIWKSGPNRGKCSQIKSNYPGEFCSTLVPVFKIPDDHLEGIEVYNFSYPLPLENSVPTGKGIKNTDFVVYVHMGSSESCYQETTLAHAFHCQQDTTMRPIAAYVNICPVQWNYLNGTSNNLVNILIHEMFHTLGFSKNLFHQFKYSQRKNLVILNEGIARLRIPAVIREMQNHFNCATEDFGGPLMNEGSETILTSHWHPRLMYGSLMTPNLQQAAMSYIDRITLAIFEDTGWYRVNYSSADDYFWGKDGGCNFGMLHECRMQNERSQHYGIFCSQQEKDTSQTSCDFLHFTKTTCDSNSAIEPCYAFLPNFTSSCIVPVSSSVVGELVSTSSNSRCFLFKHKNKVEPVCLQRRCSPDTESLEVFLTDEWLLCPWGLKVDVSMKMGHESSILCPSLKTVCINTPTSIEEMGEEVDFYSNSDVIEETKKESSSEAWKTVNFFGEILILLFLLNYLIIS